MTRPRSHIKSAYGHCYGEWIAEQASQGDNVICDRCNEGTPERTASEINGHVYCPECAAITNELIKENHEDTN